MLFTGRSAQLLAAHDNELRPYIANGIVFASLVKPPASQELICRVRKSGRGVSTVRALYAAGFGILLGVSLQLQADDMADSYNKMCEKIKSCAMKNMGQVDLSPDMRAMVTASLDGMCVSLQQQFDGVVSKHPLYSSAAACLKSMTGLSCDEIENMEDSATPECARYEKMAENYE
tara:strand:- start:3586 stop:4110 length:525 start_codon:yes stop_codon:yes gene_type:complete